jgi:hypothetical protein
MPMKVSDNMWEGKDRGCTQSLGSIKISLLMWLKLMQVILDPTLYIQ